MAELMNSGRRHCFNDRAVFARLVAGSLTALLCSGCFTGQSPTASRIRPDTNDRYYPQHEIHFVEKGQRSKGVLVSATGGFENAFSASWVTMLVPTPPSKLIGPIWCGRKSDRDQASAIATLSAYRNVFYTEMYADQVRFRFGEQAVWILSTNPFVLGLPAGDPRRSWREFAVMATGVQDPSPIGPLPPFVARYVVDQELDQPLARLVVFPPDFWKEKTGGEHTLPGTSLQIAVVTLSSPLRIDEALDAVALGDPMRLGTVHAVPYFENSGSEKDMARSRIGDRKRLMRQ